jgi:hypothetical protein
MKVNRDPVCDRRHSATKGASDIHWRFRSECDIWISKGDHGMMEDEMWKLLVMWTAVAVAVLIMYGPAVADFSSR